MSTRTTELLYYDDQMATGCSATVVETTSVDDQTAVVLDRTVFYPAGGGQPGDRGRITVKNKATIEFTVVDTEKKDGTVYHIVEESDLEALSPGVSVSANLDWSRRYDYMQQHSGQHLLSGALVREAKASTISVHQGEEYITIEVDRSALADEVLHRVETAARRIIAENRPIRSFEIDSADLPSYSLRRPTGRTGRIRLVEIDDFDLVACGGVHLPSTGLIGGVKIIGSETIRGHLRIYAVLGERAYRDYDLKHRVSAHAAQAFSSKVSEVPIRLDAALREIKDLHRDRRILTERLAELTAVSLLADHPVRLVHTMKNEDPEFFSALTKELSNRQSISACIINRTSTGTQWAIVATSVDESDFPDLRKRIVEPAGAKGGGKYPVMQGVCDSHENLIRLFQDVL